ncbi:CUE domain-containing protein 1 [Nilaparvata lugens]|uniref:CUE domain-containing protein 1 n=1 Tax=Nilaparvata lugens TaxID=108931 RepID=UPI00193CCDAE|nr:CUE domain-containing protein 1 [Nilaparvata lugens]
MATVQQQTTQLEFHQAMADFKTMFPAMDDDVIEAVLRSNQGAVDATIDQLLAMTTDNENEKIRHELDDDLDESGQPLMSSAARAERGAAASGTSTPKMKKHDEPSDCPTLLDETPDLLSQVPVYASPTRLSDESEGAAAVPCDVVTSASNAGASLVTSGSNSGTPLRQQMGWVPPLLGQLPDDFLRLTLTSDATSSKQTENELLEDERIALFLQNEEFMAELRWNKDFLSMLDKDSPPEERLTSFPHKGSDEEDIFKERLRNMGKMSRKKFSQLARVFTGRKKRTSAKQILAPSRDNLLLQEDDSDGV